MSCSSVSTLSEFQIDEITERCFKRDAFLFVCHHEQQASSVPESELTVIITGVSSNQEEDC